MIFSVPFATSFAQVTRAGADMASNLERLKHTRKCYIIRVLRRHGHSPSKANVKMMRRINGVVNDKGRVVFVNMPENLVMKLWRRDNDIYL